MNRRLVGALLLALACSDSGAPDAGGDGSVADAGRSDAGAEPTQAEPRPDAAASADASPAGAATATPEACGLTIPGCPDPPPRYADVEPIFVEHCVPCHSGAPGGPWPLVDYVHVASWFAEIRMTLLACEMPPLDAGTQISAEEAELVLTWIDCGLPN